MNDVSKFFYGHTVLHTKYFKLKDVEYILSILKNFGLIAEIE